jgi:hypothetical protein
MKKLKSILIGTSVAAINIVPTATQIIKPERCTGSCSSCGFSCVSSIAGIALIGIATLGFKKIKAKCNWITSVFQRKI